MAPPPPPPPPPSCFPFTSRKPKRLADANSYNYEEDDSKRSSIERLKHSGSYSPTATLTSAAEKLSFDTDTIDYDTAPPEVAEERGAKPLFGRSNTTKSLTKNRAIGNAGGGSRRFPWGSRKEKERQKELQALRELPLTPGGSHQMVSIAMNSSHEGSLPRYHSPNGTPEGSYPTSPQHPNRSASLSYTEPVTAPNTNNHTRSNTMSTMRTNNTQNTQTSYDSKASRGTDQSRSTARTARTKTSGRSQDTITPTPRPPPPQARPGLKDSDSSSTLVGSAYERKINDVDSYKGPPDTTERLKALRELMDKDGLDY